MSDVIPVPPKPTPTVLPFHTPDVIVPTWVIPVYAPAIRAEAIVPVRLVAVKFVSDAPFPEKELAVTAPVKFPVAALNPLTAVNSPLKFPVTALIPSVNTNR